MIREGQVVLFTFPRSDHVGGILRPALVLRRVPGLHDDWLICMITSRIHQEVPGLDVIIHDTDDDYPETGLKMTSLVRIARLAVVEADVLHGPIGELSPERLEGIRQRLARWIMGIPAKTDSEE